MKNVLVAILDARNAMLISASNVPKDLKWKIILVFNVILFCKLAVTLYF